MKKRIRNLAMLSLIAGSTFVFSCKNEGKKDAATSPNQSEMTQEDGDKTTMEKYEGEGLNAEFKDDKTAAIYKDYVAIKDAFVNTDAETAASKAKDLEAKAKDHKEIANAAGDIAQTNDVNKQREAFSKLTKAMEPVMTGALASGEIYKQYCPMAFEGEGDFWYSNSKDIFNPYYGDKMLKCGRVEATIQ